DQLAEDLKELDEAAITRTERLRIAIVAGELLGRDEATARLAILQKELTPDGNLARDAAWLAKLYTDGPASIPAEASDALVQRHGWFGRLALSFQLDGGADSRSEVTSGG